MPQVLHIPQIDTLNDEEFFAFCEANRGNGMNFERDKNGQIIFISPTGSIGGHHDGEIFVEIKLWNRQQKSGVVFPSSTGFILPDSSIKSPDVAWVSRKRWEQIPSELRKKFAPICPDFVIEVISESDTWDEHIRKMQEWLVNGCKLGWLIDPSQKTCMIFRVDDTNPSKMPFGIINGGDVLEGLEIDLRTVFEDIS
ncbi:Uma2 family endonuclease [Runella zeae]|uniref:Uma2 family endonuclease n=1 Tax=Runella zeae TaxID=94255 RepID=UPI002356FD7D|nr:Uma2 family endonuclease [Runella zeae]